MGRDIAGQVETLAECVCFLDALGHDLRVVEVVLAHAQTVARLTGVHRVGAIGEGVAHSFEGAGRGQQFGSVEHDRGLRKKAAA